MSALYEISSQYLRLTETLADADFDLTTIGDTIDASGLLDEFTDKAQALEFVARGALAHNHTIDAEIARLTALKTRREAVATGVRGYLMENMKRIGISKISCPLFSISLVNNPPSILVHDSLSLPKAYWTTSEPKPPVLAPDKAYIKRCLLDGEYVPGASLLYTQRLVIK